MEKQSKEPKEMTAAEFELYKKETMAIIDNQLPLLRKQIEYQQCMTEMEELKARYYRAQVTIANIMAPEPTPEPKPEDKS